MSLVTKPRLHLDQVVTSSGPQSPEITTCDYDGPVAWIRTYARSRPAVLTPEHLVRTDRGWLRASDVVPGDWMLVPADRRPELTVNEIDALLPPPPAPRRAQVDTTRLTGVRLPVTKKQLAAHLEAGLTYQEIAERYGRKNKCSTGNWVAFYGLNVPSGNVIDRGCVHDTDFWRVVGMWIAEGSRTQSRKSAKEKNVVVWTFAWHEWNTLARFVVQTLARHGLPANKHRIRNHPNGFPTERDWSATGVRASSAQLAAILKQVGTNARNKVAPDWLARMPKAFALAVAEGWADGDGADHKGGTRVSSASHDLRDSMQRLLARHGISSQDMALRGDRQGELRWGQDADSYSTYVAKDGLWVRVREVGAEHYGGEVVDVVTGAGDCTVENLLVAAGRTDVLVYVTPNRMDRPWHDSRPPAPGVQIEEVGPPAGGRTCEWCGGPMDGKRRDSVVCSDLCRKRRSVRKLELGENEPWFDKPRCINGHEYTDENTYVSPSGIRACRRCRSDAARRHQERKRAEAARSSRESPVCRLPQTPDTMRHWGHDRGHHP